MDYYFMQFLFNFIFLGMLIYIRKLILNDLYKSFKENIYGILIFYFIFTPIFGYIIFKPEIFNGWRHFYFIYIGIIFLVHILFKRYKIKKYLYKFNFYSLFSLNTVFILNWSLKIILTNLFFNSLSKNMRIILS